MFKQLKGNEGTREQLKKNYRILSEKIVEMLKQKLEIGETKENCEEIQKPVEEELIFSDLKLLPLLYCDTGGRFSLHSDEFVVLPLYHYNYI